MAAPTESVDDFSLAGLRHVLSRLAAQIDRLQTEVAEQSKVVEELQLAVTVRDVGYLREEPGAGKPHARICEGEAEWLIYSTTSRKIKNRIVHR